MTPQDDSQQSTNGAPASNLQAGPGSTPGTALATGAAKIAPLNQEEFELICAELQTLVGAQLQECVQTSSELGLGFYHAQDMLWLWFDLNPRRPLVIRMRGKAPHRKKITRPVLLFIKARVVGRRLASVRVDQEQGRVLVFTFHRAQDEAEQGPCEIEVRLFPHGPNVIVRDGQRAVSEQKPKEATAPPRAPDSAPMKVRTWGEIEELWHAAHSPHQGNREVSSRKLASSALGSSPAEKEKVEREYRKVVDKKEKALERMREELEKKTSGVYSSIGEWIKANWTLNVPTEWQSYIDPTQSISANIEECFRQAKENLRKAEGTKTRIAQVENELADLRALGAERWAQSLLSGSRHGSQGKTQDNFLSRADARGRRMKVAEDLEVFVGKSAADNLALLRKAQPFDYWLHLRDFPGSHAILRRGRNRMVNDQELQMAGRWVVEQSLGKRTHELKGERYDLLVVECRYVRPIKGDKLGRVNYSNDRVITLRL